MVEIIEVKDAVGQSKTDFLTKSMGMGRVWVEHKDLDTMKKLAESNGVNFIFKKCEEYFFRANEVTYYYEEY